MILMGFEDETNDFMMRKKALLMIRRGYTTQYIEDSQIQ